jgi:hypothetical protein
VARERSRQCPIVLYCHIGSRAGRFAGLMGWFACWRSFCWSYGVVRMLTSHWISHQDRSMYMKPSKQWTLRFWQHQVAVHAPFHPRGMALQLHSNPIPKRVFMPDISSWISWISISIFRKNDTDSFSRHQTFGTWSYVQSCCTMKNNMCWLLRTKTREECTWLGYLFRNPSPVGRQYLVRLRWIRFHGSWIQYYMSW